MKEETWRRLDASFAEFPILVAGPAPVEEVDAASDQLGLPFPLDYREFLLRYGGAIVGPNDIFGVRAPEVRPKGPTVVEATHRYREQRWPGVEEWIIISDDGYGNPYGLAPDGQVWTSDHNFGGIVPIARDFEEFLNRHCLDRIG